MIHQKQHIVPLVMNLLLLLQQEMISGLVQALNLQLLNTTTMMDNVFHQGSYAGIHKTMDMLVMDIVVEQHGEQTTTALSMIQ